LTRTTALGLEWNMPAPTGEPIAPTATGAVAAALANVGQGFVPLGRNGESNGHQPRGSFDGLEDLGLDGKDVQAQVRCVGSLFACIIFTVSCVA
jgi:hypothetical protein